LFNSQYQPIEQINHECYYCKLNRFSGNRYKCSCQYKYTVHQYYQKESSQCNSLSRTQRILARRGRHSKQTVVTRDEYVGVLCRTLHRETDLQMQSRSAWSKQSKYDSCLACIYHFGRSLRRRLLMADSRSVCSTLLRMCLNLVILFRAVIVVFDVSVQKASVQRVDIHSTRGSVRSLASMTLRRHLAGLCAIRWATPRHPRRDATGDRPTGTARAVPSA